ncbi:hypothetical protein [Enterococcus sp. 2201sp1_2201st1_B8_2201SCRN_220225]|uniref:hypothetical protein n=1 Tax=unclassified Enterococcus TaxID=2608891 RepID=UPI0034A47FFB
MKIEIKYHSTEPIFVDATEDEIKGIQPALTEKDEYGNLITAAIFLGGFPYSPVGIQYIRPVTEETTD